MGPYKTPGVYVEEISTFPPSVAEVSTAIPAFIGYTAKGPTNTPTRISTMLEYEELFGGAKPTTFTVSVTGDDVSISKKQADSGTEQRDWLMYYDLRMYFKNGGGSCYIISVGNYEATPAQADFEAGLAALEKEDEPTLILLTDAVNLPEYYDLCQQALAQCGKLKDRFAILDVLKDDKTGTQFRAASLTDLKYGAAYYPYLQTTLSYVYEETGVDVSETGTLAELQNSDTATYSRIKTELANQRIILPPSSAMAGIYARVDRERGVWKAPANVAVASVIGPTVKITNDEQDKLNVDESGKSINAIRSFTGKGTLVWGARTLAGNDNEWRYINVRRLFNMIEESTQKATAFAVFEPNDATTWLKVKGMIESYLYGLWEQGALAGPTPESAYYVNVGLGTTMTTQDVLEGRMIVEMGIAAVRPAEFIVLRFSHKLQEA